MPLTFALDVDASALDCPVAGTEALFGGLRDVDLHRLAVGLHAGRCDQERRHRHEHSAETQPPSVTWGLIRTACTRYSDAYVQ